MKITASALTITLALLFSLMTGMQFLNFGMANPFSQSVYSGESSTDIQVKPPSILVFSPENNAAYNKKDVSLALNVSIRDSKGIYSDDFHFTNGLSLQEIYYVADWQENSTLVFHKPDTQDWINDLTKVYFLGNYYELDDWEKKSAQINFENFSLNLANISDGKHNIKVFATGEGSDYYIFNWYSYHKTACASVNFSVDTASPKISILSLRNRAYSKSNVTLDFTVNEPSLKVTYSLDAKENLTISGNTTITGLSNGVHNVTVYAWDVAGNAGASETIFFNVEVPDPFPAVPVAAASVASIAVVGVGLLVYFKKRKRGAMRS